MRFGGQSELSHRLIKKLDFIYLIGNLFGGCWRAASAWPRRKRLPSCATSDQRLRHPSASMSLQSGLSVHLALPSAGLRTIVGIGIRVR